MITAYNIKIHDGPNLSEITKALENDGPHSEIGNPSDVMFDTSVMAVESGMSVNIGRHDLFVRVIGVRRKSQASFVYQGRLITEYIIIGYAMIPGSGRIRPIEILYNTRSKTGSIIA